MELEELHSRIHDVWQAHDQLVSITGADDGVTGQDLDSRLQALEHDMQQVHVKTEELDRHINKILTKMIEFANQGGAGMTFISYIMSYNVFFSSFIKRRKMYACMLGSIVEATVQSRAQSSAQRCKAFVLNQFCTSRQEGIVGVVWILLLFASACYLHIAFDMPLTGKHELLVRLCDTRMRFTLCPPTLTCFAAVALTSFLLQFSCQSCKMLQFLTMYHSIVIFTLLLFQCYFV